MRGQNNGDYDVILPEHINAGRRFWDTQIDQGSDGKSRSAGTDGYDFLDSLLFMLLSQ